MKFGLEEEDLRRIAASIGTNPRVEEALIFGSRAKGNYRPGSDIDIALVGKNLVFVDLLDLANALDELWLPVRIDLCIYHRIEEHALVDHINRVGQSIFER